MKKLTCFVTLFFLLIACRKEEMQTYRVPKSSDSANLPAGGATVAERPLANTPPPFDNTLLPEGHPPVVPALPPGHPEMGGGEMSMANASAQGLVPPSAPKGDVTWEVPRGWQEKPGSGFRYATFVIPGEGAITGDLSVTVLEGNAGAFSPTSIAGAASSVCRS
ncbi:MAG: hypothetical protein IPN90_13280 [Elusimicrobia bacterium]|nr:hypothetical protein [Elusimicrobiota bacterium]